MHVYLHTHTHTQADDWEHVRDSLMHARRYIRFAFPRLSLIPISAPPDLLNLCSNPMLRSHPPPLIYSVLVPASIV
nr:hypothetical transcript [Hymenolepis microstoma]